jgi:hypothetical protein
MAPVRSETKPLMLPLPAWASTAVAVQRTRMHAKRKRRIVVTLTLQFFMAIFTDSLQNIRSQLSKQD